MRLSTAIALTLLAAPAAQAYDWAEDDAALRLNPAYEETQTLCRTLAATPLPEGDRPDTATAASLKECDAQALYYGIGIPADPMRARQCASLERAAGKDSPFAGDALLMTIYANGNGAARDLDLATRLACGIKGAPAETDGRIRHLQAMKSAAVPADFDFCDDITSGLAGGFCAAHRAAIENEKRNADLAEATAGWSAEENAAYAPVEKALADFIDARQANETDLSGTARAAFMIEEEDTRRNEERDMLRALKDGTAPHLTAADLKAADRALNEVYRKVMARGDPQWGTVTKDGIRKTERVWLRYRDAWAVFAARAYPATGADGMRAWLSQKRTALLREFLD